MFGLPSFEKLGDPRDLAKLFETGMEKWTQFRNMEDARYVGLTCPRMLMRLPYGKATKPIEGFDFEEDVDGTDSNKYLWGSAAFALAERITNAFALYRWCAAIRGAEGGGKVEGLPIHRFKTSEGDMAVKVPTEVSITDRREKELSDLGFIPLVFCKNTNYATFFGAPTTNKAKTYDSDAANANARISAQLPYVMAASRFAHYLKVLARDKVGSFMTKEDVSGYLNRWIMQYVLGKDDAGQNLKAKYPLREARVDVYDVPGRPGAYRAVVYVRPHFQLDELTASIRLVANLPPPAA
jgi:type VI secretion system protein ImpC